jgi:coenzyme Q-binding protein COQ10
MPVVLIAGCATVPVPQVHGAEMTEFRITRTIDAPRDLVYEIVSDIERYPEFVPGFADARIDKADARTLYVTQKVGLKAFSASFRSVAELTPPEGIKIRSTDWPFAYLQQEWTITDLGDGRTQVVFDSRYALVSRRVERLVGRFLDQTLRQTVDAFERRIRQVAARRKRRESRTG